MIFFMVIQFITIGILLWYIQTNKDQTTVLQEEKIATSENFLRTTAMGLAMRFSNPSEDGPSKDALEEEQTSDLFSKQTEADFISFASQIIQHKDGGTVYITGDPTHNSPHFEIERADGTYIGMSFVASMDISYEPIALLHSHLIKDQAQGGYIITTSDFTEHAYRYAQTLEITLIHGVQLANFWLQSMDYTYYEKEPSTRSTQG